MVWNRWSIHAQTRKRKLVSGNGKVNESDNRAKWRQNCNSRLERWYNDGVDSSDRDDVMVQRGSYEHRIN